MHSMQHYPISFLCFLSKPPEIIRKPQDFLTISVGIGKKQRRNELNSNSSYSKHYIFRTIVMNPVESTKPVFVK